MQLNVKSSKRRLSFNWDKPIKSINIFHQLGPKICHPDHLKMTINCRNKSCTNSFHYSTTWAFLKPRQIPKLSGVVFQQGCKDQLLRQHVTNKSRHSLNNLTSTIKLQNHEHHHLSSKNNAHV